jgi:putative transposase
MRIPISPGRRAYDHRLRELVCEGRDPMMFQDLGVPRSTAASWLRRGPRPVVTSEVLALDEQELQAEVLLLQRRIRFLLGIIRLAFLLVRLSGFRLDSLRVPAARAKRSILAAVEHAPNAVPLAVALRVLRLSPARYHAWSKLSQDCPLDDRSSCPRTSPSQLTAKEIGDMREMVESQDHRHMTIRALALHAQQGEKVFASPTTWARLARERGWLRASHRVYPAKPKDDIRASEPNQYWHIDVSIVKLLDGTRTYLHALIDNFSRRILAWKLVLRLEPQTTCQILVEAAKNLPKGDGATVVTDSGIENVNQEVDDLLGLGQLHRILAQVEVSYSN